MGFFLALSRLTLSLNVRSLLLRSLGFALANLLGFALTQQVFCPLLFTTLLGSLLGGALSLALCLVLCLRVLFGTLLPCLGLLGFLFPLCSAFLDPKFTVALCNTLTANGCLPGPLLRATFIGDRLSLAFGTLLGLALASHCLETLLFASTFHGPLGSTLS